MKKNRVRLFLTALVVSMLLGLSIGAMESQAATYYTVTATMNFRKIPNGTIMSTVPEGATVLFLREVDNWDQVTYNGVTGWIYGGYLASPVSYDFTYVVKVDSGYLALRTAKAYKYENEIGELHTGDTVQVWDNSDSTYWYVFSEDLNKAGYVNKNYLLDVNDYEVRTVKVAKNYLALRTAKAYEYENEIGELYTGEQVRVLEKPEDEDYWFVYAPSLEKYGYVNKNYLIDPETSKTTTTTTTTSLYVPMTVKVSDGYLALRNAKAFDYYNEIGKLYTGQTVYVTDTADSQYWYVYAPSLKKSGYVNKDYLY